MIADNLFEGGEVSYDAVRKSGATGDINAQIMVTDNTFTDPGQANGRSANYHIRRPADRGLHTNDSFWIVRGNDTDGNGPVLFDITRWNVDGAGAEVASDTDRWGDECGN
tara:strand:+ start:15 stop:344 length:330 start_codon:yes stop_codon:yes gene_type:complete